MSEQLDLEEAMKSLPQNFTMRDIFDFCTKYKLHNLAQGMIELAPPLKLRQRVADLCLNNEEIHQYRNRFGEQEYRVAIQKFLERNYQIKAPIDSILAISGVSGGIFSTLMTLKSEIGSGIRVGLLSPFYTYHQRQIQESIGHEPIYVDTNEDFSPNFDNIEKALKEGLDILMFCNPGNPQGNVWTREQILKVVELTEKYKSKLLIDEIYCDLVWRGEYFTPIKEKIYEHVIIVRGFAKTLAAQSWRVGYLIAHPDMTAKVMRIHDPIYISVTWQQHAIAQYLTEDYDDFVRHVKEISDLMQYNWKVLSNVLHKELGWIPIEPNGSMYGMFKHQSKTDKEAIMLGLKYGVGVAPGRIFFQGMPENTGYTRIHCGITKEKADAIVKMIQEKKNSQ